MDPNVRICNSRDEWVSYACSQILEAARQALGARGQFSWMLSGGSTPGPVYAAMRQQRGFDWAHTDVFWGDERCVPPDDAASNYRMAREQLLDHVPIPSSRVHRIAGEQPPVEAARQYADELEDFFPEGRGPDLVFLGLGEDGHTASLFPGLAALAERRHCVVAEFVPRFSAWRISCTPLLLNRAARVVFLVEGSAKAPVLAQVLGPRRDPVTWPAQALRPQGSLCWVVDQAAAGQLI